MISPRCKKCQNVGCNNDNFICNSWSEEKRKEYAEQYKNGSDLLKITNIAHELNGSLLRGIERIVKRTPNDMELGKLVREFFAENK